MIACSLTSSSKYTFPVETLLISILSTSGLVTLISFIFTSPDIEDTIIIFTVPSLTPFTFPFPSTVAILLSSELHSTSLPPFSSEASNFTVLPISTSFGPVRVNSNGLTVTLTSAVTSKPSMLTRIFVVPMFTPLIFPFASTVAILVSLLANLITTSSENSTVAVNFFSSFKATLISDTTFSFGCSFSPHATRKPTAKTNSITKNAF